MIHPLAYVDKTAELGRSVRIGPHCYVGPRVVLGDDCELRNNVTITGGAVCGKQNVFFAGTVIGEDPQDLKYRGEETRLIVGDDNVFRECVTANRGTEVAGGVTRIGSHNRFMAYVHIAHDVIVGDYCILSNAVQLAGHVELEDQVTMGGLVGVHHFTTIGRLSYIAGMARIPNDVPPFMIWGGDPGAIRGYNLTGLRRWGMDEERIRSIRDAYRILFGKRAEEYGATIQERLARLESSGPLTEEVEYLCRSVRESMDQGVYGRKRERYRRDTDADRARYYR
ncbi:MAG TPA: acyl-ACP--UDP-N-acetylglucosamine O-acyltransferase, partial [Phycisphaerae bacterium]|nr:acyl-ACP--UDP-N-acetylglucosamine O-acyltransferase [Phycisphaerae bacterium]